MSRCEADYLSMRYLAGDMDPQEFDNYRRHLEGCAACRQTFDEDLWLADALLFSKGLRHPAGRVWRTIERQVRPNRRRWPQVTVAAAALALILGLGLGHMLGWAESQAENTAVAPRYFAARLKSTDSSASGQVMAWSGLDRMMLVANNLPPLPQGQVYEVWTLNGRGPVPVGMLKLRKGTGWYSGPADIVPGDEIVVCVEERSWVGKWVGPAVLTGGLLAK